MGDEDFTREELIELGEIDPDAEQETSTEESETQDQEGAAGEGPEESETEQAAEEKQAGSAPDGEKETREEPDSVQKRIDQLTWEREEHKRKLDLLKQDPEEYYRRFPDERPAPRAEATAPEAGKPPTFREALGMVVKGGPHDGQTLRDLMASGNPEDQADAYDIYNGYVRGLEQQQAQAKTKETEIQERVTREHTAFVASRSKELFGKGAEALTPTERDKVERVFNQILDEMEATDDSGMTWAERHGVYNPDSAYRLLSVNDRIKAGVKAIIDSARKGGPTHIEGKSTGGGGGGGGTVYDQLMGLSAAKVAERLDSMSDTKVEAFWEAAPPDFRKKFKSLADAWV